MVVESIFSPILVTLARFDASDRIDKHCIVSLLVSKIKESSGRFLRSNLVGEWEEVNDEAANQRVSHTFWDFRQQKKK